jgi:hypothetical protein
METASITIDEHPRLTRLSARTLAFALLPAPEDFKDSL